MDDEEFLRINRAITRNFVNLYLQNDPDIQSRSPEERERGKASIQRLKTEPTHDEISLQVALKIRQVGDQLDGRLKHKIKEAMQDLITEQSVWEIGYGQFSSTCSGILSSCQGYVSNGWDQVSVVYIMAGQLISELRYQQDDGGLPGPREQQMEGYTGTFLSDSGLQEWTQERGGMATVISDKINENSSVPFSGTEYYAIIEISIKARKSGGIDTKVHGISVVGRVDMTEEVAANFSFLTVDELIDDTGTETGNLSPG